MGEGEGLFQTIVQRFAAKSPVQIIALADRLGLRVRSARVRGSERLGPGRSPAGVLWTLAMPEPLDPAHPQPLAFNDSVSFRVLLCPTDATAGPIDGGTVHQRPRGSTS